MSTEDEIKSSESEAAKTEEHIQAASSEGVDKASEELSENELDQVAGGVAQKQNPLYSPYL